jgi:hypothetical protein
MKGTGVQPGDVYLRRHPDGRYGAVRVLRVEGCALVLCTTAYLAYEPPQPAAPQLRQPVLQHRFSFTGQPAVAWVEGGPPPAFAFAFNLPPDAGERQAECPTHRGAWTDQEGFEAWLEWRWEFDRAALEAEVRAQQACQGGGTPGTLP